MVKKIGILDAQNIVVTLKSWATGIIAGVILIIPIMISKVLIMRQMYGIGMIILLLSLLANLWVWGYLSRKLWRWN